MTNLHTEEDDYNSVPSIRCIVFCLTMILLIVVVGVIFARLSNPDPSISQIISETTVSGDYITLNNIDSSVIPLSKINAVAKYWDNYLIINEKRCFEYKRRNSRDADYITINSYLIKRRSKEW